MRRIVLFGTVVLVGFMSMPQSLMAEVRVNVNVGLPPIVIGGPPDMVMVPDSDDVYVAPDVDVDLFFWSGWWWRPWQGHWYRSHYCDRGWVRYKSVPRFYAKVGPHWRGSYQERTWHGHPWHEKRVPGRHLERHQPDRQQGRPGAGHPGHHGH